MNSLKRRSRRHGVREKDVIYVEGESCIEVAEVANYSFRKLLKKAT